MVPRSNGVPTMLTNLSLLDRSQLEAIVLGTRTPASDDASQALQCFDTVIAGYLPPATSAKSRQLQHVLAAAHELLTRIAAEAIRGRSAIESPQMLKDYLQIIFAGAQRESFVVIYLDAQNRVIH